MDRGGGPRDTKLEREGCQLSPRQSLLWLDEQLFPQTSLHHLVLTIELRGPLDVPRLQAAWLQVAGSRDSFRVVVDESSDQQVFVDSAPCTLEVALVDAEVRSSWVAERSIRPIEKAGPRWDAVLVQSAPDDHLFYLCQHHVATDPASLLAVAQDLEARYEGRKEAPAASFQDYLLEEQAYRNSPQARDDQAFWESVLESGAPPLRPYGIARTDRSVGIERAWLHGGNVRAARLAAIADREPFQMPEAFHGRLLVLATALTAYLYRVTGSREILLGVPVANRSEAFSRTSGLLMEQLFLRATLEPLDSFAALARRLRTALTESLSHGRACVSDHGMEYVALQFLPAIPPLFRDLQGKVAVTPGAVLGRGQSGSADLRETLALVAHDFAGASAEIAMDFHRATFDETVRRRAVTHFTRILDALAADPGAVIDAVDLVGAEERSEVLRAARGANPESDAPDVLARLSEQVARRPEALAVEAHDGSLTFAEVDALSNRLAHRLRKLGVVRESRVGVAVPRGAGELLALLATLKAGGAYVPVDPTHPVDRVRVILEDAAPDVLVAPSGSPLVGAMPASTRHLAFDEIAAITAGEEPSPLQEFYGYDQLAYILFTSGSTGRPKGVEVLRGAFANFLRSMAHTPGLAEGDRVLAITTTTFDISGLELFLPLWVGATVVIVDRDTAVDPQRLLARLKRDHISVMQATPATWRLLIEAGWKGDGHLRMLCGGEAMSPEMAARLLERGKELWNVYGPTETTVWSTADRIVDASDRITIGRPIDRTQVFILDPALNVVPVGVVGEIFIGGDGLARGYRGRPDLTSERFLENPYGEPGARFYRTGDLGRLLADGRFECLGRVDHQVKIRGFRIELGEIESALRSLSDVQEVVVVADAQAGTDPRLIAYWVGGAERTALFEQARRKLPPYMVPSAFLRLDSFPLTTSGKIDRKALPRPEPEAPIRGSLVRPRNDLETRLAAVWSSLLGLDEIGIDQDFFSLGGTSVLAIQARARIEKELGVELPLRAFFESPTVDGIVRHIGRSGDEDDPIVVQLRRGRGDLPPLFCLAGVQLYQDIALALDGERTVFGIHVPIRYRPSREPCPSVPEIARRYVELIRRQQPQGPYHLAGLCFGGIVAFEAARQLEAAGAAVPVVAVFDGYMPGAMRIDRWVLIREYIRRGIRDPGAAIKKLVERGRRVLAWGGARGVETRSGPSREFAGEDPVEVPIDGGDVDAEALRYGHTAGRIEGELLVFRATGRDQPPWIQLTPDLGWHPHSRKLKALDIVCEHLDIVRGANAGTVATALDESMRQGPAGPETGAR